MPQARRSVVCRRRPCGCASLRDLCIVVAVADAAEARLQITYPQEGTLFPPESVAPTFVWEDKTGNADSLGRRGSRSTPAARCCGLRSTRRAGDLRRRTGSRSSSAAWSAMPR